MIRIGLLGSHGRTGHWVSQLIDTDYSETAVLTSQPQRHESLAPLLNTDVIIDFSSPSAMSTLIKLALDESSQARSPCPAFVVGSTGWQKPELEALEALSSFTPTLLSSNFSFGIYFLTEALKTYSPLLEKLGYSPVILESHHHHKKDSPSGTALSLSRAIDPIHPDRIQTHSIRAGEIIGDHQVSFYGPADHLVFAHSAQDRSLFARGAIEVALWLANLRNRFGQLPQRDRVILGMDSYFKSLATKEIL